MELRVAILSIFFIRETVTIMAPRHPFNKPAQQVIVDLMNQALIKTFAYSAVEVAPVVTSFAGPSCMELPALWPRHHCRERASFIATVEGYKNSLQCNYYKLHLDRYIRDAVIVGDHTSLEQEILDALQVRYNVLLDPDEVVVDVYGNPTEDGSYRCVVRPMIGHLVWEGSLEMLLVSEDHIALTVNSRDLGPLDLQGDPDIAQEVYEQMLSDLVLFQ